MQQKNLWPAGLRPATIVYGQELGIRAPALNLQIEPHADRHFASDYAILPPPERTGIDVD